MEVEAEYLMKTLRVFSHPKEPQLPCCLPSCCFCCAIHPHERKKEPRREENSADGFFPYQFVLASSCRLPRRKKNAGCARKGRRREKKPSTESREAQRKTFFKDKRLLNIIEAGTSRKKTFPALSTSDFSLFSCLRLSTFSSSSTLVCHQISRRFFYSSRRLHEMESKN